jgi:hypothetical protein
MKINGALVFDASSASEIQNLRVQKVSSNPTWTSSDVGRFIYNTTNSTVYYGGATDWVALASGGVAFSQTEGDNIETTLGAGINGDGTLNAAGFTSNAALGTVTSFTNAINQLAAYAVGNNQLAELDDVALSSPADGQYLRYNGTTWVNDTFTLADIAELTVTAAELNELHSAGAVNADFVKLHALTGSAADLNLLTGAAAGTGAFTGAAVSSTELSYLDGATSNLQTQINGKQATDADLSAIAALAGTGIAVRTAADTWALRSLVAPAAGITITDPAGVAGNPTFALANDLAALEGLTTTGYIVRTGDGTATTRAITGTAGNVVVTNGNGVASDTTVNLAAVTQGSGGTFSKVTLDGFGRVTENTAVTTADITALVDATYVNVVGDTMTGTLTMSGASTHIVLPNAPTLDTHAANKAYVDAFNTGLTWKNAVRVATTGNITIATDLNSGDTIDGVTLADGDRVLVKSQTTASQNGIYVVGATPVRASDMDAASEFDGAAVFVKEGTTNESSGWTQTATVTTVGTDTVTFSQFTGGALYTWGTGLSNSGNTINVNLGAGIAQLPSDEVGIDLFNATTGAIILTQDGTARSTNTAAALHLLLAASGGLTQDATGLYIPAAGVTNAMLVNSSVTINGDSGTPDPVALGETLQIIGTSAQGISTAVGANTLTITAADASTAAKGVARFAAGDFDVTAGLVTIKAAGIDNGQLANSTLNFVGTDASADTVALGESLTFASAVTGLVSVAVATNTATVNVRLATAAATGVASFDSNHFTVTAGAVSLDASLNDLNNVSSADAAATGSILVKSAGDWQAATPAAVGGTILLGDLSDVGTATPTDGHVLVGDGSAWNNQKMYHLHTQASAATTWTVTHAIGTLYCNVTVVDSTDEVVIPQSIKFDSTSQLTVTFNTAITGKVVVMGIA